MNDLPETITQELFISLTDYDTVTVTTSDMTEFGYTVLAKTSITIEVPKGIDVEALKIESLERNKKKIMANAQVKIDKIDDVIKSMLSIESK